MDTYKYLRPLLNEILDYNVTTKSVAHQQHVLLAFSYRSIEPLEGRRLMSTQNSMTQLSGLSSVTEPQYGETKKYSTINAVHHRACRFFLGIGKYVPNAAINGDMRWIPRA